MLLQEAIDARKTQISSVIKSLKDKALEKRKEVEQLKKKSTEVQDQVADVKSQVQRNVDQITAIIRVKKQNLLIQLIIMRKNHSNLSNRKKTNWKIKRE